MSSQVRQPVREWRLDQVSGLSHLMVGAHVESASRIIEFACGLQSWASNLYPIPDAVKCTNCILKQDNPVRRTVLKPTTEAGWREYFNLDAEEKGILDSAQNEVEEE